MDPDDQDARHDEDIALAHLREISRQAGAAAHASGDERLAPPPR